MRPRALLFYLLTLATGVGAYKIISVTTDELTVYLDDSETLTENSVSGPGEAVLSLVCGTNVFPVANSELQTSSELLVNSLCPLKTFTATIEWMRQPDENIQFFDGTRPLMKGTILGLVVTATYDQCADGKDFCDSPGQWYQLGEKEFQATQCDDCNGGYITSIDEILPADIRPFYPLLGNFCVRKVSLPLWEVLNVESGQHVELFDDMSFLTEESGSLVLKPRHSTRREGGKELGEITVAERRRVKREDATSTTYQICEDCTTTTTATTTSKFSTPSKPTTTATVTPGCCDTIYPLTTTAAPTISTTVEETSTTAQLTTETTTTVTSTTVTSAATSSTSTSPPTSTAQTTQSTAPTTVSSTTVTSGVTSSTSTSPPPYTAQTPQSTAPTTLPPAAAITSTGSWEQCSLLYPTSSTTTTATTTTPTTTTTTPTTTAPLWTMCTYTTTTMTTSTPTTTSTTSTSTASTSTETSSTSTSTATSTSTSTTMTTSSTSTATSTPTTSSSTTTPTTVTTASASTPSTTTTGSTAAPTTPSTSGTSTSTQPSTNSATSSSSTAPTSTSSTLSTSSTSSSPINSSTSASSSTTLTSPSTTSTDGSTQTTETTSPSAASTGSTETSASTASSATTTVSTSTGGSTGSQATSDGTSGSTSPPTGSSSPSSETTVGATSLTTLDRSQQSSVTTDGAAGITSTSQTVSSTTDSGASGTTTLGQNIDCSISSGSLNISTVADAPSQVALPADAFVEATLENTGTCELLNWTVDGTSSEGGRLKRATLTEGDHTICCSMGSQKISCGYVTMLSSVPWSNACEDKALTVYTNESLVVTAPLPPTDNVNYQWSCSRSDSAECYTDFGKRLTMQRTVSMKPVTDFLNGVGSYVLIANVTDLTTGEWSCRRYAVQVVDYTTIGTTGSTETGTTAATGSSEESESTATYTSSDATDSSNQSEGTEATAPPTITLGQNENCQVSSASLNLSTIQAAPTEIITTSTAYITANLQSSGTCARLSWVIDSGTAFEAGTTIVETLSTGDHKVCCSLGPHQLVCGYIRILSSAPFTNACEDAAATVHPNESLVMSSPAVQSDSVSFKWTCVKEGSATCYTELGSSLAMQKTVTMTPVGPFLDGSGVFNLIANATDLETGQWSCRRFAVTVVDWTLTTTGASTGTGVSGTSDVTGTTSSGVDGTGSSEGSEETGGSSISSGSISTLDPSKLDSTTSSTSDTNGSGSSSSGSGGTGEDGEETAGSTSASGDGSGTGSTSGTEGAGDSTAAKGLTTTGSGSGDGDRSSTTQGSGTSSDGAGGGAKSTVESTTKIPVTISPELQEKIDTIVDMINQINNPQEVKDQCAQNISNLALQYSNMSAQELQSVAKATSDGTLTSANGNTTEVLKAISSSMECVNTQLAEKMQEIIKNLTSIPIDSAESLNEVLKTLMGALNASLTSTLKTAGAGGDQVLQGSFVVLYGTIVADQYTLVTARSTVRIVGTDAYIYGDIRPALLQSNDVNLLIKNAETFGSQGAFGGKDLYVDYSASVARDLNADKEYVRMDGVMALLDGDGPTDMRMLIWNTTVDSLGGNSQSQKSTAVTFWVEVTSASVQMDGSQVSTEAETSGKSLSATVFYDGSSYTISASSGTAKVVENRGTECILQYDGAITVTPTGSDLDGLQMPIVLENVACSSLAASTISTPAVLLPANSTHPMGLVVPYTNTHDPPILPISSTLSNIVLPFGEAGTADQLTQKMNQGLPVLITGTISTKTAAITLSSGDTVQYTGSYLIFVYGTAKTQLILNSPNWRVGTVNGQVCLVVSSCVNRNPTEKHTVTQVEVSTTATIYLTGGTIIRNGSHGYVIANAVINHTGILPPGAVDLEAQSLLNQESQNLVMGILKDTASFLRANGSQMTMDELNDTATSLLTMSGQIIENIINSMNNPLSADLLKNLQYAKDNYNSLYNVLPDDPGDIMYVEEYTEEEWAQAATKLVQQQIARQMAAQLMDTMSALGDAYAEKLMSQAPYTFSIAAGGGTLVEAGGNETSLLSQLYSCNNWTTAFPPHLSDLNVQDPGPSDLFRVSMFCFLQNPYSYSNNYDSLITSGILELSLKRTDGEVIPVNKAEKTINITGLSNDLVDYGTEIDATPYSFIQILTVRTFHTSAWNYSIVLEISVDSSALPAGARAYAFVSFQGLPGPMPRNHDFRFAINSNLTVNTFFMDGRELKNSSGLYFVGVGARLAASDNTTVNYTIDSETWAFSHCLVVSYTVRALTKGCYSFNIPTDFFDSTNITVPFLYGDRYVQCNTHHLSSFSLGLLSPAFELLFDFQYVMDIKPLILSAFLLLAVVFLFYLGGMAAAMVSEMKDREAGQLRHLYDNRRGDKYIYIVVVETGHHMYSTTSSKIMFNLNGTEGQTIARSLVANEDGDLEKPFQWGRSARFIMTTRWPLGDLKYLRLWIDEPGQEHTESWFCKRVIFKDIQTEQCYFFPVNNWLGSNTAEGKTERLAEAVPKTTSWREALSWHLLCEKISYIAMFTGGGGMLRTRVSRFTQAINLCSVTILAMYINDKLIVNAVYENQPATILGYQCDLLDIVIGVGTAVFILFTCEIIPFLMKNYISYPEMLTLVQFKRENPDFTIPKPDRVSIIALLVSLVLFLADYIALTKLMRDTGQYPEDNSNAFVRRVGFGLLLWVLLLEPLKGFFKSWYTVCYNHDHNIVFPVERALLPIEPLGHFLKANPALRDDGVGTTFADLTQLAATRSARAREDRLFHTMKEVLLLLAALGIFMGLSLCSRDADGFYYQTQLRTQFNVDPPSKDLPFTRTLSFLEIKNAEDFWRWANDSLANNLLANWYDGQPAWDMRGFMNDKVSRAMGNGVLRQVRSQSKPCELISGVGRFKECLIDIDQSGTLTGSYRTSWLTENGTTVDQFSYRTGESLMNVALEGEFFDYAGGGYTISLGGSTTSFQSLVTQMKQEGWLDKWTRAIVVEFSVYNAQINYFAVVQLLLEMPKGRVFLPSAWVEPLRLIKYEGSTGTATMIFELLYITYALVLFVKECIYYIYCRYRKMKRDRFPRNPLIWPWHILFSELAFWDFVNLLVGFLSAGSIVAFILRNVYVSNALDLFTANNGNAYINLSTQRSVEMLFNVCYAGVVFFISCKMIKILRFNRRIAILADTLAAAGEDVANFGMSFLLCCCAFNAALFGLLWYELEGYRTAMATAQTTIAALLGKFVITNLYGVSSLASIFFVAYLLTGTIVLLNIYVMIIMTWFEEVRNDPARQANDYELLDHLTTKVKRQLGLYDREDRPAMGSHDYEEECTDIKNFMAKTYLAQHLTLVAKETAEGRGNVGIGSVQLGHLSIKNVPADLE